MIRASVAAFALALGAHASAAEFASIAAPGAILYDGPSSNARKLFVAPSGMPVELISVIRVWVRIRDADGDLLWVERDRISQERNVVTVAPALVRRFANDTSEVLFQADKGVLLDLLDARPAPGWVRVRHRDGTSGFVRAADVWGV